jgi:hypothetical protein
MEGICRVASQLRHGAAEFGPLCRSSARTLGFGPQSCKAGSDHLASTCCNNKTGRNVEEIRPAPAPRSPWWLIAWTGSLRLPVLEGGAVQIGGRVRLPSWGRDFRIEVRWSCDEASCDVAHTLGDGWARICSGDLLRIQRPGIEVVPRRPLLIPDPLDVARAAQRARRASVDKDAAHARTPLLLRDASLCGEDMGLVPGL